MKKTFLLSICFLLAAIGYAEDTTTPTPQEIGGTVIVSTSTVPKLKRTPANTDVIVIIKNDYIDICCNVIHGLGCFQITDLSTNYSTAGGIDSSLNSITTIPFVVSNSTSFDFYIEFEDGSWCHLTWN